MKPGELDAMLDGMDESLQPLNPEEAKNAEEANKSAEELEAAKNEENLEDEPKLDDDGNPIVEDEPKLDEDGNPIVEDEDEGVTVSEFEAEGDDPNKKAEEEKKTEELKPDTSGFSPEQRFIYDGLPTVTTVDKDGKQYQVKTFAELPADFEFANKRDELAFSNAMNAQESNARELQGKFRNNQAEEANKDFIRKEQLADKIDLNELQEAGEFPKFKIKPNEKGFEESAPALLMADVLEYKEELNKAAFERAQKNGTIMRVVGFKEAYDLYRFYDKGEKKAVDTKKKTAQQQEDEQRKGVARRQNKANGSAAKGSEQRPVLHSKRDIDNFIDSLD